MVGEEGKVGKIGKVGKEGKVGKVGVGLIVTHSRIGYIGLYC